MSVTLANALITKINKESIACQGRKKKDARELIDKRSSVEAALNDQLIHSYVFDVHTKSTRNRRQCNTVRTLCWLFLFLHYYRVSQKRRNIFRKFKKSHTIKFVTMSCRRQGA